MRMPVVLHEISSFDEELLGSVAIPIVKALSRCVTDQSLLKNQITASPDFWSILQQLHQHPEAGPFVFELLQTIVESTPPIVNADNYESTIALANDFIRAGSVGALEERQKDAVSRRPKGAKQSRYLSLPFLILSFYVYESRAKTLNSENHVVARGVKAIGFIYHLTGRVPSLISQSHLEKHEGMKNQPH